MQEESTARRDVRAKTQDGAEVVPSVADVDDAVKRLPSTVALHELVELLSCVRKNDGQRLSKVAETRTHP